MDISKIFIVFLFLFIILVVCLNVPQNELYTNSWQCLDEINTPIREHNGEIECMTKNGRDCLWKRTGKACDKLVEKPPKNVKPLICGKMTLKKWGTRGYDNPDHWCAKARVSMTERRLNTGPWKCLEGINTPVRKNPDGDIECMSKNEHDCMWRKNFSDCYQLVVDPPENIRPLVCGEMTKRKWGTYGYDNPNHWCAKAKRLIDDDTACSISSCSVD